MNSDEVKLKCNCEKEVNVNKISLNFKYIGCDKENNPIFKCKDCGICVYG